MYLGEQLPKPTDARLMLAAQLGVQHIVVEMGSDLYDASETGRGYVGRIRDVQARAAAHGISVDVIGLEMGSLLIDIIRGNTARRDAQIAVITHNIRAAAEAGVPCLKYALHIIGIPRTGRTPGRGGALYSHFDIAEATDDALVAYTGAASGQSRAAESGRSRRKSRGMPLRGSSNGSSRSRRSAASLSPFTRRTRHCRRIPACAASIMCSAAWTA